MTIVFKFILLDSDPAGRAFMRAFAQFSFVLGHVDAAHKHETINARNLNKGADRLMLFNIFFYAFGFAMRMSLALDQSIFALGFVLPEGRLGISKYLVTPILCVHTLKA